MAFTSLQKLMFTIFLSPNKLVRNYNKLQTEDKCSELKEMLLKAPKTRHFVFQDRSRADEELMTPHSSLCLQTLMHKGSWMHKAQHSRRAPVQWLICTYPVVTVTSGLAHFFNGQNQFMSFLKNQQKVAKILQIYSGENKERGKVDCVTWPKSTSSKCITNVVSNDYFFDFQVAFNPEEVWKNKI